ncbi:MAG: response regulator [Candidatus Omnitrophota bacterium]
MNKKILIVEDEKEVLSFLADSLKRRNFIVETSADGRDAIKKTGSFNPDLVLLDIMLPEISGLEVLSWIKKNKPDIFVMLASAKKELEDLKTGYSLEADYYITKPYTIEEIIKGINIMFSFRENQFN